MTGAAGKSCDLIDPGAGPAGENVSDRVVQGGLSVAVVEDELADGECSYRACMPTKALLRRGNRCAGTDDPADRAPRRRHRHRLLRAHTECAGSLVRAASGRFVPAPPGANAVAQDGTFCRVGC